MSPGKTKARQPGQQVAARLGRQVREALEAFINGLLDDPENNPRLEAGEGGAPLAGKLWQQGVILAYRLLVVSLMEAMAARPGKAFRFVFSKEWQEVFSPRQALAPQVERILGRRAPAGGGEDGSSPELERALRELFRLFIDGADMGEGMCIRPLGGMLFSPGATALLDGLRWGEQATARLLRCLLWLRGDSRLPGSPVLHDELEVEVLGRIYEGLLGLQPGIATEPMCRLRRGRLESVVPAAQGEPYRRRASAPKRGPVKWVEPIAPGRFYLQAGSGRKSAGAYYTPRPLVRFLVEQTLGALATEGDPDLERRLLRLRVLDPAMGSAHFLVEACRYLGDRLYEASPRDGTEEEEDMAAARLRCRGLVARRCLYGVDRDPMAVELARMSLWLETGAEGWPLDFLDHRLMCGDSLTGPSLDHLKTYPVSGKALLPADEAAALWRRLDQSLTSHPAQDGGDPLLASLKLLAAAWSGGVALALPGCDPVYASLLEVLCRGEDLAAMAEQTPLAREMVRAGQAGLCYELAFPEVFHPSPGGFDAVVGNPPWDRVRPLYREFLGAHDFRVLAAHTARESRVVVEELLQDAGLCRSFERYKEAFVRTGRLHRRLFSWQQLKVNGVVAGRGNSDAYLLFAERFLQLTRRGGLLGCLVPSGFHSNEGGAGVRRLYLERASLRCCFSFANKRRLFDIDARFKFALVVARKIKPGSEHSFEARFYLQDPCWLFSTGRREESLQYSPRFIRAAGGALLTFPEIDGQRSMEVARQLFQNQSRASTWQGLSFVGELDMSRDAPRFVPASSYLATEEDPRDPDVARRLLDQGLLLLHDDKTFAHFSERTRRHSPRYLVPRGLLAGRADILHRAQHYRVAFRKITGATNWRTCVIALLPPGTVVGNAAYVEKAPQHRPNSVALLLLGLYGSFTFDWIVRLKTQTNLNLYILDSCPMPDELTPAAARFLCHAALRLSCNHEGYAALWHEQVGEAWQEHGPPLAWPALSGEDERWAQRAALDAVVAHAYGLHRRQYEHLLSCFSHRTYAPAPERCLTAFDALSAAGEEAYCGSADPYSGISICGDLPEPMIWLGGEQTAQGGRPT